MDLTDLETKLLELNPWALYTLDDICVFIPEVVCFFGSSEPREIFALQNLQTTNFLSTSQIEKNCQSAERFLDILLINILVHA